MEVTLPQARESEEALIGSILINPSMYDECAFIEPSDFYFPANNEAWAAIKKLKGLKRDIDIITVSELGIDSAYLTGLITKVPDSYNAKSYAETIRDKSRRRVQVQIANAIVKGAYNGGVNISKIVGDLVGTSDLKKKARHISEGLGVFYDELLERYKNPKKVYGISTGYKELDEFTGGLHKKQALMISGAPGTGKSVLASCIVLQSALKGTGWAIYSLEMPEEDLKARWVGMLCGLSEEQILSGVFPANKWDEITHSIEILESLPIYINDTPSMDTASISADIAQMQADKQIDAILVDYLELLADKGENANEATAAKSRNFREICREKDLAGVIIQSMTKEGIGAATGGVVSGGNETGKKSFASAQAALIGVRGPADVTHDADTIFMLVVDPADPSGKTIAALPAKKRRGVGNKTPIRFKWHKLAPKLEEANITFRPNE